ncbi:AIPR family protein [Mycobacteroides abscessus]|uniref:AIPR family protein n=1 Tax=Mycobacteroides abscessus TaxID=36809 RepID=UPI000928DE22|nr:AIPR family protein [Mycobacteroides abscessus]SIK99400.1 AIPR protein [Mycobacteroides abscessus subsp. abscessus]
MSEGHGDEWLADECRFYAREYDYKETELERGLEGYAAHLFAQEQGFDEVLGGHPTRKVDLREFICRRNDLGIDVVLEDSFNDRILLVQAAWRKKSSSLDESKIGAFFDAPQRISSGDYRKTGGDQIQDLLDGFEQKVQDGWQVILRFVTNASVGANEKLQALVASKQLAYEDAGQNVVCELYGESELRVRKEELQSAISGGLVGEVTLNLQEGKIFELKHPYRTLVGAIKGNELVNLYNTRNVGTNLFNLNVRLPLATQKVNPKMIETVASKDEGPNFFYYNNGVSAVCSEYTLDQSGKLTAKRLQIINGAQTVSSLVKGFRQNPHNDVYVLFRLTETTESYGGSFTDNVIRYNNTQNPVLASDFFSNDPIQLWLRDSLPKVSGKGPIPNFYYIYKSGYKPNGATGSGVKIDEFAKIRHAFLHGPLLSYRSPRDIFGNDRVAYWEAFGVDKKPVELWPEEELYKVGAALALNKHIQGIAAALKADESTKNGDEAKYLKRMSRYAMALVATGLEVTRPKTFQDYSTLTASTPTFMKHVDPILKEARRSLLSEYKRRKAERPEQQPEYNLARDAKAWERLRDEIREMTAANLI